MVVIKARAIAQNEVALDLREAQFLRGIHERRRPFRDLGRLGHELSFFVLVATTFPMISEALWEEKVTVGPPYYNAWVQPIGLTIFFTVAVMIALLFFAIRYRRGAKVDRSNPVHTSHTLELAWSVPPRGTHTSCPGWTG